MSPSNNCIALIKRFEGLRQEAYRDSGGVPTIGWGHTKNVRMGDFVTPEEAEYMLTEDLRDHVAGVLPLLLVAVTQGQFDALVDFAFNLGINALKSSTLLRKLNEGDKVGAVQEFGRWILDNNMPLPGLIDRRAAEAKFFIQS